MKMHPALWAISISLGGLAVAQEKAPVPAAASAVEGIKGVKQDAVEKVKNVESGITTGAKNAVEAVNKVNGVETIKGVKADGQTPVQPVPPVPVQPVVQPVISGAGTIQAVNGVTGINTAKLQNLEAALQLKHEAAGPPTGAKGRAAAAGLGPPNGKPGPKPKEDGRAGFQEFEKLQNAGS